MLEIFWFLYYNCVGFTSAESCATLQLVRNRRYKYISSRCDGIGRRSGLKIHRSRGRAGSSPATGTTPSV